MARPRVFVSSTYYDLKHIRASLENFIESLGFDAVLFGGQPGSGVFSVDRRAHKTATSRTARHPRFVRRSRRLRTTHGTDTGRASGTLFQRRPAGSPTIEWNERLMNMHFRARLARQPMRFIAGSASLGKSLFLLLLPVALCIAGCSSGQERIDETKQKGNQIIRALEQFRTDRGQYPKSLADLSPKYIQELPLPTWGLKAWQYESDGSEFTLTVNESVHTGNGDSRWLRYQGEKWGWQVGD